MINTAQVTVGTTATELSVGAAYRDEGYSLRVKAPAAVTLYVGGSDVTTTNGWQIAAGATESFDLKANDRLYAVVAAATEAVAVLRLGI